MIITKAPFRISFFGGGTDYPAWFSKHGGAVLSTTIDKYCWISARWLPPFFGIKHRVVWSHIETVQGIDEILHPCVKGALRFLEFDDERGVEVRHTGDLPARAGMGSSSSFAVALVAALLALRNGESARPSRLARTAIALEQDVLKEWVGCQDQVAAAYGGFNLIKFNMNGEFVIRPVQAEGLDLWELNRRLMLFYTGTTRLATNVAKSIVTNLKRREAQLLMMRHYVDEGKRLLCAGDLDGFGCLMHDNWLLKRRLSSEVSNAKIDGIYLAARNAGALGGKLLGAGSGGFMCFYVPPGKQAAVKETLEGMGLLCVPFAFENEGCSIVYEG